MASYNLENNSNDGNDNDNRQITSNNFVKNGVNQMNINSRSSSGSSSSVGKKTWWACLYTKHKTRKRKIWQDGKIQIYTNRAVLFGTTPGNTGILDQVDLTPAQVTVGQTLESEQHLITLEGPWNDEQNQTNVATNQNSNTISRRPFYSSSMQKLFQGGKKKKIRSHSYIPPPPQQEQQMKLESSWQRNRKAPLQPGQLQQQYYGTNNPNANQYNRNNNNSNFGMQQDRNNMMTRHNQPQISGPLQRSNNYSNDSTSNNPYHRPNNSFNNNNNNNNTHRHDFQNQNMDSQSRNDTNNMSSSTTQLQQPNKDAIHSNQNNPFLKKPLSNGHMDQNKSQGNNIHPNNNKKKNEFVSNDFDPTSFYGSDDDDDDDDDEGHTSIDGGNEGPLWNNNPYNGNNNRNPSKYSNTYNPFKDNNRNVDDLTPLSPNANSGGNPNSNTFPQPFVAGRRNPIIAKVTPNMDNNNHHHHHHDRNGSDGDFLEQFIAGTKNNTNNKNKTSNHYSNVTRNTNDVNRNVPGQTMDNSRVVSNDDKLMMVSTDNNNNNNNTTSLNNNHSNDVSNSHKCNSGDAMPAVTTKDDLLELFGTSTNNNDNNNDNNSSNDDSNKSTEEKLGYGISDDRITNQTIEKKNETRNSFWTTGPSLATDDDDDHLLIESPEKETETIPQSNLPIIEGTKNKDATFELSIPSASSSSDSSSSSSSSDSSTTSESDNDE